MLRPSTRLLALVSLAALSVLAACSSDSATGPNAAVMSNAQAYATFDTVYSDSARKPSSGDLASEGMLAAALGAPVRDIDVSINGQAETFHSLTIGIRQVDSTGAPKDSSIAVVGWRGTRASELFVAFVHDSAGVSGYPSGDITYVRDTSVYYATAGAGATMTASLVAGTNACTPTSPSQNDPWTAVFVAAMKSCTGASATATFTASLGGMSTGSTSFSFSLSQAPAIRVVLRPINLL